MAAMLRRLPALAGLAALAAIGAELAGHRAFARLVRRDVQALRGPGRPRPGRGWSPRRCSRICPSRSAATCATTG